MRPSDGRVGEQHAAYRKGLVLGLTMAEVGILIIFVLLLLIGYQQTRYTRTLQQLAGLQQSLQSQEGSTTIDRTQLARLTESQARLTEVAKALGIPEERPTDDFRRLVRVVQQASSSPEAKADLAEARKELDEIKGASQQMRKLAANKGQEDLLKQAEAQSFRIANQEGQLKRYEKQLQDAGEGKGERPCWVEADGTIDYLYEIVLDSTGIRMREKMYQERLEERNDLPLPPVDPDEPLTESELLSRTESLYRYSQSLSCRFFVIVYDATGEQEKPRYKSELRAVEGHFYKRLSTQHAPF